MQLTGSQVIIECLKEQGVDTVFGYPGGAILNVYDELYKHPEIRQLPYMCLIKFKAFGIISYQRLSCKLYYTIFLSVLSQSRYSSFPFPA